MGESTVKLAKQVAEGTADRATLQRFKTAVSIVGYHGHRGGGIVNHKGETVARSWKALAADLLAEREQESEPEPAPAPESKTEVTYFYTTRTPYVPLTLDTSVQAIIKSELPTLEEGPCETNRTDGCTADHPQPGIHRTVPVSMLADKQTRCAVQCLDCYEVSAKEYVQLLHQGM